MNSKSTLATSDRAWVDGLYRQVFPNLMRIIHNTSKGTQLRGIDLYLEFEGQNWLKIDEKIRWRDYYLNDILLEEYSNFEKATPGWTWDLHKVTDYIGYIIVPTQKFWLLDYLKLRELWQEQYLVWSAKYEREFGKTYSKEGKLLYQTSNLPIPLFELSDTIVFTSQ